MNTPTTFKTDFKSDILSRDNICPGTKCFGTKCLLTVKGCRIFCPSIVIIKLFILHIGNRRQIGIDKTQQEIYINYSEDVSLKSDHTYTIKRVFIRIWRDCLRGLRWSEGNKLSARGEAQAPRGNNLLAVHAYKYMRMRYST